MYHLFPSLSDGTHNSLGDETNLFDQFGYGEANNLEIIHKRLEGWFDSSAGTGLNLAHQACLDLKVNSIGDRGHGDGHVVNNVVHAMYVPRKLGNEVAFGIVLGNPA